MGRVRLGFFWIVVAAGIAYAQTQSGDGIRIAWDFDNGSLGGWTLGPHGEIVLTHSPTSGEIWYHFRIDGVEGKTLSFVFENARKDFYGGDALPAISYDQESWYLIKNRQIQPHPVNLNQVRFSFTHTFAADRAWLAFTPPYTNKRLDAFLSSISSHPHVTVENLGQTPIQKLSMPAIVITDPETSPGEKQGVLFLAREEALESASSWLCEGLVRFLLSEDPVAAAIKRRCLVLAIPLFDRDGVALGTAVHPLAADGGLVYWTETWPETSYSFYEQRQLKRYLQGWKDTGKSLHYSFRLHSSAWNQDQFRREQCAETLLAAQEKFYAELLTQKYLPGYHNLERVLQDTRFSKFAADLFPLVMTGLCQSEFQYENAFGLACTLYKSTDDLGTEGQLLAYALAEALGIPASDPPPFLHAAEIYEIAEPAERTFHVRCIYRDLLNRPPLYVRVTVGDQPIDLQASRIGTAELDYRLGVLYTGYFQSRETVGSHFFSASNGSRIAQIPQTGSRVGPLLYSPAASRRR